MGGRMRAAPICASRDVPDLIVPELEAELGTLRRPWTAEEDAVLRAYYGRVPSSKIAAHLGRQIGGVHSRAIRMGIRGI
jgi:hypothetical protein